MWKNKAIEVMRSANLKLTPQRLKLIELIADLGIKHPTLSEILEKMREEFPTTSFSTLYTNVLMLKALKLLDVFTIGDEMRIELNLKPHLNIFEGEIRDFEDEELVKRIEERIGRKIKFLIAFVESERR
uniref:Transcriptional repressor n=1 Tax=Archaeoglobus fulgidus TaxID=2234 RepID=A0A7J3M5A2_ARCFL